MALRRALWTSRFLLRSSFCQSANSRHLLLSVRNFSVSDDDPDAEWDRMYQRGVPRTMEEMSSMLRGSIDSPPDSKLLKVSIIGVPNSGKSTLINSLMDWRVCSVSSKVHTTRSNARAMLNQGSTQVVFLDTPGLVTPTDVNKHSLQRSMMTEAEMSLQTADLLCVMHDMSNRFTFNQLHPTVLRLLALYPKIPSVLVLNKIDLLKSKKQLLDTTRLLTDGVVKGKKIDYVVEKREEDLDEEKLIAKTLRAEKNMNKETRYKMPVDRRFKKLRNDFKDVRNEDPIDKSAGEALNITAQMSDQEILDFMRERKGWPKFQEVFFLSAVYGSGVDDLRDYFFAKAYKSPWIFNSSIVTDQNPQEIVLTTVREKFLNSFKNEIPYKIKIDLDRMSLSDSEMLYIFVKVRCPRKGLGKLLVGPRGRRIADMSREAEQDLRDTFQTEVRLRIEVEYDPSLK